ncbi:MAG: aromatic amino acid lyase, partial [Marmoricola sp.]|nr:aromatic amino acid lyase [Marmoricola sp.]
YGVNTGVGGFVDRLIPDDRAAEMQQNLVAGVATNVGQPVDRGVVRAMMIARLNSLARGNSAVKVDTLLAYAKLVNSAIVPLVPALGSLGASGDLGPLAHIAQVLQGRGRLLEPVSRPGVRTDVRKVLRAAGLDPVQLDFKEGLALINGT